jgi:hypothetical protein
MVIWLVQRTNTSIILTTDPSTAPLSQSPEGSQPGAITISISAGPHARRIRDRGWPKVTRAACWRCRWRWRWRWRCSE